MNLLVTRQHFGLSTIGELTINGEHQCWTLEPPRGSAKPCAIPLGTYDLVIRWSDRFTRLMPHVESVPGFTGILIHWGNFAKNTEGCLLVGLMKDELNDFIGESKLAFNALFSRLSESDGHMITYGGGLNERLRRD